MNDENEITIIIIDDEVESLNLLESLLNEFPFVKLLKKIDDSRSAVGEIITLQPDIVFLDTNMPVIGGMEILYELNNYLFHTHIVFITENCDFVLEAINNSAFGYLYKPIDTSKLKNVLANFFIHRLQHKNSIEKENVNNDLLRIPNSYETIFIPKDDVFYINADGNYTNIYRCNNVKTLSSYNLGKIQSLLPKNFWRIHRSSIVNSKYISSIDKRNKKVILKHNTSEIALKYSSVFWDKIGIGTSVLKVIKK